MPFWNRPDETPEDEHRIFGEEELLPLLDRELERAAAERLPYSAVVCTPRHLPDEDADAPTEVAGRSLPALIRSNDMAGRLGDGMLVVGLRDTDKTGARAFASRLKGEVALRTGHLGVHTWEAGQASFPADGATAQKLVQSATEAAVDSRHTWKGFLSIAPEKRIRAAVDAARAARNA